MARQPLPADGEVNYGTKIRAAINAAQDTADAANTVVAPASKTGSFTFDITQAGKVTEAESSAAITATVPTVDTVDWAPGTVMEVAQTGTGQITVAPATGVTLRVPTGQGLKTSAQWESIYLRKRGGTVSGLTTADLLLRFNADSITANSGAVASWADTSGNNHPAAVQATVANQPTIVTNALNGHKGVAFNSTSQFLTLSGSALNIARNRQALTVFVVYTYPAAQAGARTLFGLSTGDATTKARLVVQQREQAAGNLALGGRRGDTDASQFITGTTDAAGAANVVTGVFNWPNTELTLFKNGTQLNTNTSWLSPGNTADTTSMSGTIGCATSQTSEFFGGRICEILVYGADNSSLRTNVHNYVQNTYGITVADFGGNANEWIVTGGVA